MNDWTPRCKSCGAEILWVKMTSGKSMPVDAKPISYRTMHPGTEGVNYPSPKGNGLVTAQS